ENIPPVLPAKVQIEHDDIDTSSVATIEGLLAIGGWNNSKVLDRQYLLKRLAHDVVIVHEQNTDSIGHAPLAAAMPSAWAARGRRVIKIEPWISTSCVARKLPMGYAV